MTGVAFLSVSERYRDEPHPIVPAAHPDGLIAVYGEGTFEQTAQAGRYFMTRGRGDNPTDVRYRAVHDRVDPVRFPLGVVAEFEVDQAGRCRAVVEEAQ